MAATAPALSKYEQWIELLTRTIPSPRRRVRRSPVPYFEWIGAFKLVNRLLAALYRKAAENPEIRTKLPPAFGAIIRIMLNKVVLPEIRKLLAQKKGIESPKEALDIIESVISRLLANEEELLRYLEEAIKAYGITGATAKDYLEVTKLVLDQMKKYVGEIIKKIEAEVAKATKPPARPARR